MKTLTLISRSIVILCGLASATSFAQSVTNPAPDANDSAVAAAFDYNPSMYVLGGMNMMRPDAMFGVGDHGEGAFLALGKPLSEDWDMQINTRYGRQNANGLKYQQNMLGIDGLYMFSRSAVRPFIGLGVGGQEDRLNSTAAETRAYAPYVNGVIGVQVALNDQWALQLDFRREHGYLHTDAFDRTTNSNNYLSLGISYAFDKTPTRPVAVAPVYVPPPVAEVVEPVAPPVVVAPPPVQHYEKIVLSSTELFGFDAYTLQLPQVKLDQIAVALNQNPQIVQIVITGYTDRIGSDKYNQRLSERRAGAVKDYLISQNVAAIRLDAVGSGKANPVVMCTNKKRKDLIVCLEPNRRVEVEQFSFDQKTR